MDLRNVFTATAVVLVAVIATSAWLGDLNAAYGTDAGESFNNTLSSVQTTLGRDLEDTSIATGDNTQTPAGPSQTSQQAGLISRSVATLQQVGAFFTIIPNLLQDGGVLLGLPPAIAAVGAWTFTFALGISLVLLYLSLAGRWV